MIPREPDVSPWAVAALWCTALALFVAILWSWYGCEETPVATVPPGGTPSWADYVRAHPYRRDLDPAVAHPGWPGRVSSCGAGKCE